MNILEILKYTIFIIVKIILIYVGIGIFLPEEFVFSFVHGLIPIVILLGLWILIYLKK